MQITALAKQTEKLVVDNSPVILTIVGVAGTISTAVLSARAGSKARAILSEESPFLETKEKVQLVWKEFIPPVGVATITVVAIIGANRIGQRRAAALAVAYSLSEQAFTEYKDKVKERLTGPKEQAIKDEVAQDRVTKAGVSEVVIVNGNVLCHEAFTGRYFQSSMEELKKAQNDVNYMINNNYYASLTDLYDKIGLERTSFSDEVGWNCDKLLELEFSTTLSPDGRPCISVDYTVVPVRDYFRVN
jgi:hypothetical protein